MQITYQKRDGSIIQKYRKTLPPYKVGETTSMGWKVLDIKYEYNGNYYPRTEYYMMLNKRKNKSIKAKQAKQLFAREVQKFLYYFIAVLIMSYLKTFLGI